MHVCRYARMAHAHDRYMDSLCYSIDGNFHLGSKAKNTDEHDVALSEGAGYFVITKDFATYLEKLPEPPVEVSIHCCSTVCRVSTSSSRQHATNLAQWAKASTRARSRAWWPSHADICSYCLAASLIFYLARSR